MFVGTGRLCTASAIEVEAYLLTCSRLPDAICEGEEVHGGEAAGGVVEALQAAAENRSVGRRERKGIERGGPKRKDRPLAEGGKWWPARPPGLRKMIGGQGCFWFSRPQ